MSDLAAQHRDDVARTSPPAAKALREVFAAQKAWLTAGKGRRRLLKVDEVRKTKAALLPAFTKAVGIGADRVAKATGPVRRSSAPTGDVAGALAFRAATQITDTTQGQLDALTETATTADVAGVLDGRSARADLIAAGIISNAINAGANAAAATAPSTPTKTWTVTDDDPCPECAAADGETVPAGTDFANGAPYPGIHPSCHCTLAWSSSSRARALTPSERRRRLELQRWREGDTARPLSAAHLSAADRRVRLALRETEVRV